MIIIAHLICTLLNKRFSLLFKHLFLILFKYYVILYLINFHIFFFFDRIYDMTCLYIFDIF